MTPDASDVPYVPEKIHKKFHRVWTFVSMNFLKNQKYHILLFHLLYLFSTIQVIPLTQVFILSWGVTVLVQVVDLT